MFAIIFTYKFIQYSAFFPLVGTVLDHFQREAYSLGKVHIPGWERCMMIYEGLVHNLSLSRLVSLSLSLSVI